MSEKTHGEKIFPGASSGSRSQRYAGRYYTVDLPQQAIRDRLLVIIWTTPSQDTYAVAVRKTDPALLDMVDHGQVQLMNDPCWQQLNGKFRLAFYIFCHGTGRVSGPR